MHTATGKTKPEFGRISLAAAETEYARRSLWKAAAVLETGIRPVPGTAVYIRGEMAGETRRAQILLNVQLLKFHMISAGYCP